MKSPCPLNSVIVFSGPSLPSPVQMQNVAYRPPAVRGDFDDLMGHRGSVVVLLDGGFLQDGALTHWEILTLVRSGVPVIGAASIGALRASELHAHGVVGLGTVYQALVQGVFLDDSELAVAVSPDTKRALTVPLINLRRFLYLASQSEFHQRVIDQAWKLASEMYFLERTPALLIEMWDRSGAGSLVEFYKRLPSDVWNVKQSDALEAVRYAQTFGQLKEKEQRKERLDLLESPPYRTLL